MLHKDSTAHQDQGRCKSVLGRICLLLLAETAQEGDMSSGGAVSPAISRHDGSKRLAAGRPNKAALEMPEPCDGRLSCTVLSGKVADL